MSDTPPQSSDDQQSNTSKWILLGGILIVIVSVVLLFVGAFLAQRDRTYETVPTDETDARTSSAVVAEDLEAIVEHSIRVPEQALPALENIDEDADQVSTSQDVALEESEDSAETMDSSVSWARVDETTVQESQIPSFPRVVVDRALVRLNASVREMAEGHEIQFPIPQRGVVLRGEVTEVGGPPRARSIKGEVDDEGNKYPFVLTLGKGSTFATITTSTGNYELFANLTYGWLMPSANMDDHVDYTLPDHFVENPDPHAHHEHNHP